MEKYKNKRVNERKTNTQSMKMIGETESGSWQKLKKTIERVKCVEIIQLTMRVCDSIGGAESYSVSVSCVGSSCS